MKLRLDIAQIQIIDEDEGKIMATVETADIGVAKIQLHLDLHTNESWDELAAAISGAITKVA